MASHPVLITQDEKLDLTMDNTDNEQMDKPVLTMATTTQQAVKNLLLRNPFLRKLVQKDLHSFLKFQTYIPRRKLLPQEDQQEEEKEIY